VRYFDAVNQSKVLGAGAHTGMDEANLNRDFRLM
jgi:hypothetical protein